MRSMNGGKGQAATEYIVLLAIVLVITLIVVGLLGYFPGLAGGITETESLAYWRSAEPFSVLDVQWAGTSMNLSLLNNAKDTLTIQANGVAIDNTAQTNSATSFNPGEQKTLAVTTGNSCGVASTRYSVGLNLTYNTPFITGKKEVGNKNLVAKCQ